MKEKLYIFGSSFLVLLFGFLFWQFFMVHESELNEAEDRLNDNVEFDKYFTEFVIIKDEYGESYRVADHKKMPYILSSHYTDEFDNLSKDEKVDLFDKMYWIMVQKGIINLGYHKYTEIEKIQVFSQGNVDNLESYLFDYDKKNIVHFYRDENGILKSDEVTFD